MSDHTTALPDPLIDHWLYHAIIPRLESTLKLDPCPAIELASALTAGLFADAMRAKQAHEPLLDEIRSSRDTDNQK